MLTIEDFDKHTAQEYGNDPMDAIDSDDSVYLVPKQPVADLPKLRVHIWPSPYNIGNPLIWSWNWRISCPGPELPDPGIGPVIRLQIVDGKSQYDTLYGSIAEAGDAAIVSIKDYLETELPAERRRKEEEAQGEKEQRDWIQGQINDFMRG